MNDCFENIEFEELLSKVVAGEATPAEQILFEKEIAVSDQRRRQYERSLIIWEKSHNVSSGPQFNTDAAWLKLDLRIKASEGGSNIRKLGSSQPSEKVAQEISRHRSRRTWWIAASVTLLAGIAVLIYLISQPTAAPITLTATSSKVEKTLPDGSAVAINANSSLTYPAEFAGNQRKVSLKGEAYFEVQPDANKPFIIEADQALITVLGTAFNVDAKNERVEVQVAEGVVKLSSLNADTLFVLLKAGETGIYDRKTGKVEKGGRLTENDLFWNTGKLVFENMSLAEVVKDLNHAYGSNISLQNDSLADCRLTTTFRDDSLPDVLRVIALTLELQVISGSNQILLDGKGCH
ncbi:MAG: FecR domain-containing protein [Bacteroidia bacterium]